MKDQISYSIDDYNVLRIFIGNKILCEIQDVTTKEQAERLVDEEIERLNLD